MRNRTFGVVLVLAWMVSGVIAADWPQWRGPNFNGSSEAKDLPDKVDGSTKLWEVQLPGVGSGTPIVWQDRQRFED